MKFKVMLAQARLNSMYDGLLAFIQLSQALGLGTPPYVRQKTQALVEHDRILEDMVEPVTRNPQRKHAHMQNKRMRTVSHLFLD